MNARATKNIWRTINAALIVLGLWTGYGEMSPKRLIGTNPDQYFCLALLIVMPLFVLGTLYFSRCESFQRPSWSRSPFSWRGDPLQALFITTLIMFAWAVGSSLAIRGSGPLGYWTVAAFWSIFVGLVIGQLLGYAVFRTRITPTA